MDAFALNLQQGSLSGGVEIIHDLLPYCGADIAGNNFGAAVAQQGANLLQRIAEKGEYNHLDKVFAR